MVTFPIDSYVIHSRLFLICVFYCFLAVFFCPLLEVSVVRVFFDYLVDNSSYIFISFRKGCCRVLDSIREFNVREHEVIVENDILFADDAFYNQCIDFALFQFKDNFRNMCEAYNIGILNLVFSKSFLCSGFLYADGLAVKVFYLLELVSISLADDYLLFCRKRASTIQTPL